MKKLIILLMAFGAAIAAFCQKKQAPDFAFPAQVEKTARADLERAVKSGNGPATVDAAVRWSLAKAQVSSDSLPAVIAGIGRITTKINDPAAKAMLNTLLARIYTEIYEYSRYKIDERPTMASAGDDYNLWSRDRFASEVDSLTTKALADPGALRAVPLSDYAGVIDFSRADLKLYPTLYDFVAVRGIDNLSPFIPRASNVLNGRLLQFPDDTSLYPGAGSVLGHILGIYRERGQYLASRDNLPAEIDNDLARLEFINENRFIVSSVNDDEDSLYENVLIERYKEMLPRTPDAVRYLLELPASYDKVYPILSEFAASHPSYADINAVKNRLNAMSQPTANVSYNSRAVPGVPFKVTVETSNASKVTLKLYDVTAITNRENSNLQYKKVAARLGEPKATVGIEFADSVPFSKKDTVELTVPSFGRYIIVPEINGVPVGANNSQWIPVLYGTELVATKITSRPKSMAVVVNPLTGEPQNNVEVAILPWSRTSGFRRIPGKTSSEGLLPIEKSIDGPGKMIVSRGEDRYTPASSISGAGSEVSRENIKVDIETPIKLYHPGDSVTFVMVAFQKGAVEKEYRLAENRKISVVLRDANYQEIGTLDVLTDSWGRAQGAFVLPKDGLQGLFTLEATYIDSDGEVSDAGGWCGFKVSDYRLPTFFVEDVAALRPARLGDSAFVTGKAVTFAGFPVSDAIVKIQMRVRTGNWYWESLSPVFATLEGNSNADGSFSVEIPADVITAAPSPLGYFIADIAVTSVEGETQTASTAFSIGKPLSIRSEIPDVINLDKPFKAKVEAFDYKDKSQPIVLNYTIKGENSDGEIPSRTGTLTDGNLVDIIKALSTGEYKFEFAPADSTLANPLKDVSVVVYSPRSKVSPMKNKVLWLPTWDITAETSDHVSVNFGSNVDGAWIWLFVSDREGKTVENRWIRTRRGMQTVDIKLPADFDEGEVYMRGVRDYEAFNVYANLHGAMSKTAINLEVETFRDRVTPGDEETVTFRVKPVDGAMAQSAVMVSMINMAINQLFPTQLNVAMPRIEIDTPYMSGWNLGRGISYLSVPYKRLSVQNYGEPSWNFYNRGYLTSNIRIRGYAMMKSAATAAGTDDMNVVREHKAEVVVEEAEMADAAAPGLWGYTASTEGDGGSLDEVETLNPKKPGVSDSVYRPSEIPMAFFRPMLLTGEDGSLEIRYTVPDANTTWLLQGAAYNRELLSANTRVNIVASKPIMVNVNAPRFLRGGDKVTVRASVMNNTDSVVGAEGMIEVVSQSDGTVLASEKFSFDSIAAKGQQIVEVGYTADAMSPAVIFRAKASNGNFTDGEQQMVRILPSDQDVMESHMFFIAPDSTRFEMSLPALTAGGKALLNFTENPTWQVVSALPGLREGDVNSSVEAAHALFSARVADGLVRRYPEIARTLRRWAENPQDSALVSELQRNEELRQVLLSATPWVQNAQNDTQRLQRLALLLDSRETERVTRSAIELLRKTSVSGGGWCWTASYPEVSEWATGEVLLTLGLLNRMGWLPENRDLADMVEAGCRYLDAEAAKAFTKYPKGDYTLYTFTRDLFPAVKQSTASSRVSSATVQRCISEWKRQSVQGKAVSALILNSHGYKATASQILKSLREYATQTPQKGMWWQQLDHTSFWSMDRVGVTAIVLQAFASVDPKCGDIDRIRQWLLLQKQNTDWGSSAVTTMVVASILTSGSEWTVNPQGTAIHVDNNLVQPENPQYATGEFTVNLTPYMSQPSQLVIDRQANYPSFGSVVTMERRDMVDIKAVPCAEASVEKELSVYRSGEWVAADGFKAGDRVKVTLTVRVDDDLSYVVITDPRAAGLQLVDQLPTPVYSDGVCFYRENRDSSTNLYINRLRRGTYMLSYELFAAQNGVFTSGAASLQSQYNPLVTAHSAGQRITVSE